jgi:hypothetical protein
MEISKLTRNLQAGGLGVQTMSFIWAFHLLQVIMLPPGRFSSKTMKSLVNCRDLFVHSLHILLEVRSSPVYQVGYC